MHKSKNRSTDASITSGNLYQTRTENARNPVDPDPGQYGKPARQRLLLDELGDYVRRVPWTSHLREQWDRMAPSAKDAIDDVTEADKAAAWMADDVEMTARGEREVRQKRQDPFGDT